MRLFMCNDIIIMIIHSFHPENSAIDDDCDKSILSFVNTATVHETILHGGILK